MDRVTYVTKPWAISANLNFRRGTSLLRLFNLDRIRDIMYKTGEVNKISNMVEINTREGLNEKTCRLTGFDWYHVRDSNP